MTTLNAAFPHTKVKTKPGPGGRRLKFISHGLITERLNEAAPGWSSEITATHTYTDQQGRLHCAGVQLRLCLSGDNNPYMCREEAGGPSRVEDFANEIKNATSDALKRAAMRFGVALGMWEDMIDAVGDDDYDDGGPAAPRPNDPYGKPPPRQPNQEPTPIHQEKRIPQETAVWLKEECDRRKISDGDRQMLLNRLFGKTKLGLLTHAEASELQNILVDDDDDDLRARIAEAHQLNLA